MSKEINRFFDEEIKAISVSSRELTITQARELYADVQRQIKQNFRSPSRAFLRGLKIYEVVDGAVVRLSPILSAHAQGNTLKGDPNVWILLPDGARLGFKRIGKEFNWSTLKRRYGTRLSFVEVEDGTVVLYRDRNGGVYPVYKLQSSVTTKQRIKFFESAERIANERT